MSPEHAPFFETALAEIQSSKSFRSYLQEHSLTLEQIKISYDFQAEATDAIALDVQSKSIVRDANNEPLLRKSGHGALISNLSQLNAAGIWLQNIDNILYETPRISEMVLNNKMLMAGLALTRQSEIHQLVDELTAAHDNSAEITQVNEKALQYLKDVICTDVTPNSEDPIVVNRDLIELLSRPIVIAGYVPLAPGQKGGGPFVLEETLGSLTVRKVNTVEGSEFDGGQDNPIFAKGEFFNPVNLFILRNRPDGSLIDLNECVDHSRSFTSDKTDAKGNAIKAYERPGLWNGSLAKVLQISIAVPAETFAAVKNCAGKESLLADLHQPQ